MKRVKPRTARIKMPREAYEDLRLQVLARDKWRCQNCGSLRNLHLHHKTFRSQSGDDSELNLITLCGSCHSNEHNSSTKRGSARPYPGFPRLAD
jgi:5-methylcytosine-specific restriction endonuclease McrA